MTEVQPTDPLAKTWANPDAARVWLKRNPQPGLVVKFDSEQGVFRLAADGTVDPEPEQIEVDVPEVAQEPEVPEPAENTKAEKPAVELPAMPTDPTRGLLISEALLCIDGLPTDSSTALTWAKEFARKLGKPITIRTSEGDTVGTVDATYLAAVKAATAKPKKTGSRGAKTNPDGKRMQIIALCLREHGASTRELVELTGWHKCPWKWTVGSNKNGTGFCDRYNYGFRSEKVGGEVRYFLTPAAAFQKDAA
jgi:hypothetical protein